MKPIFRPHVRLWLRVVALGVSLGLVVLGALSLWLVVSEMLELAELRRRGIVVTGKAVDKRSWPPTQRPKEYQVGYSFVAKGPEGGAGAKEIYGWAQVSSDFYHSVRIGQEVPVRYIPQDPGKHTVGKVDAARIWLTPLRWRYLHLSVCGPAVLAVGMCVLTRSFVRGRKERNADE